MVKFIHAADIHLDSPLRGLSRYEGAPVEEIRQATRRALENLVALAIRNDVDFVLIAGDLYDGNWKDHNTGLFFAKQMAELRKADIRVFIVAGNHDAQSVMTKLLKLPENVYQFPTRHPETQYLKDIGVAVHGQGFHAPAITSDLSAAYPRADPDAFNIGLLHTSLTGREGHDNYAPCTVEGLIQRGYDYWAFGHVHAREQVVADTQIWFPGNVQGRHIREIGPKGCLLVIVDESRNINVEFHELDVLRWSKLPVNASNARNHNDCLDKFRSELSDVLEKSNGRTVAVRVIVSGASEAHEAISSRPDSFLSDIHSVANDHGDGKVWVEKVVLSTRPILTQKLEGPLEELMRVFDSFHTDEAALGELSKELASLVMKLPHELREGIDSLQLDNPEKLKTIIKQAQPMLFARLRGTESIS